MRTSFEADNYRSQGRECRGIAQSGSAPALGAGCREFESLYPDHFSAVNSLLQLNVLMVGVAQLVERRIVIPVVVGSIPIVHPIFLS